ncbi:MAG TPA: alpha/beta hydrolase [Solirubrobacteraceae bacterium]
MRRRRTLLAAAALATALGAAGPADAQITWRQCTDPGFGAFECGRATVAIDRSGGFPGTIDLFIRRLVAPANADRRAIVYLSGGPGQAASEGAAGAAEALAPGLRDRDLIAFDQRGTGASAALECAAVRQNVTAGRAAQSCANEIGARRAFFRTQDSVADIEDLRVAAGYERLAFYGVSYGTKVALAYAARFPARVEALVLDSTVPPEGPDPLLRSSFRASGRVLAHLCGAGRCRGVTRDPAADLRRLQRRETITGRYVTPRGRIRRGRTPSTALYEMLAAGDLNPAWRALMPGAMRSAALGDETPLLRLATSIQGGGGAQAPSGGGAQAPSSGVNQALFLATVCEEVAFPWDRAAGVDARLDQANAALRAIPESAFAPFNRATAVRASLVPLCFGWPNASPPPDRPGELPRVPALVLSGEADVRTPLEDAGGVAARLGATPVAVPHVGHSVLGSDPSRCAQAAVAAFFRDFSTPACPPGIDPLVRPVRRAPRSLREVPAARRYKGRVGRTLNAVAFTQRDAVVAALGAQLDDATRIGGVRRGTIVVTDAGISLRGVELVPGVRVTGLFPTRGNRARVRVTGRAAARGRLTITRGGGVTGVLGGRRIRARPRAAVARAAGWGVPDASRFAPVPALRAP